MGAMRARQAVLLPALAALIAIYGPLGASAARALSQQGAQQAVAGGALPAAPLGARTVALSPVTVAQSMGHANGEVSADAVIVQGDSARKLSLPAEHVLVADREYLATLGTAATAADVERVTSTIKEFHGHVISTASTASEEWTGVAFQAPRQRARLARLLQALVDLPQVSVVEPNAVATVAPVASEASALPAAAQSGAPWGIDRIDGVYGDGYRYSTGGAGVCVYILDTGVRSILPDFSGRVLPGAAASYQGDEEGQGSDDHNGHGTHVAGTSVGTTYGIAKAATLVPVRILSNAGSGTADVIISGINWVVNDTRSQCKKKIINMSLGFGARMASVERVVESAIAAGVVVVVAAGNEASDACGSTPAAVRGALTVGATNAPLSGGSDTMTSFSNWGACVDVFAPGSKIPSNNMDGGVLTLSGTSMASPHAAGMVARLLGAGSCSTPAECIKDLVDGAQSTVAGVPSGTTNKLAVVPPSL